MSFICWRKSGKTSKKYISGAWAHYVYNDANGKPVWKKLRTQNKQIAEMKKVDFDKIIAIKGDLIVEAECTWDGYLKEYLENYKSSHAEHSATSLLIAANWFKKLMEPKRLADIKPSHFETFKTRLLDHKIHPATINSYLGYIRPIFAAAHADGRIPTNPSYNVKRIKFPKREPNVFEYNQCEDILERARIANNPSMAAAILLLCDTGVRLDELAHQLIENTNLEKGYLDIRNHDGNCRCERCEKRAVHGWHTKNYCERMVPLTPRLKSALQEFIDGRKQGCLFTCHTNTIQKALKRYMLDAGIGRLNGVAKLEKLSPHTFRHTLATDMRRAGVDEKVRDSILGHGNRSIGDHYNHTDLAEVIAEFNKLVRYRDEQAKVRALRFKVI